MTNATEPSSMQAIPTSRSGGFSDSWEAKNVEPSSSRRPALCARNGPRCDQSRPATRYSMEIMEVRLVPLAIELSPSSVALCPGPEQGDPGRLPERTPAPPGPRDTTAAGRTCRARPSRTHLHYTARKREDPMALKAWQARPRVSICSLSVVYLACAGASQKLKRLMCGSRMV